MKMKHGIVLLVVVVLNSCGLFKEKGIHFRIENNSDSPITGVKFYTSERLQVATFDKIEANKNRTGFLSMQENKTDGHYSLAFISINGKKERISDGYYTNGSPIENEMVFDIRTDTTLVSFNRRAIAHGFNSPTLAWK